jgi:hypothetical protein
MSANSSLPARGRQPGAPVHAARQPARLRVISGGLDDAVLRRKQFEDAHPEIVITAPGPRTCLWIARRDGTIVASGYQLSALLDTLSRLAGEQP